MIDDKKIEAAKEEIYEDRFLLNGEEIVFNNDEKEEMFYEGDIKEAIGLGAKWAINEFLNDLNELLRPASEVPRNDNGKILAFSKANSNMNTEKLERANILAKSLIPKVNELLNMSTKSMRSSLADAIYGLSECDEEFKTKFKQLLNETKQRFQKEFDDL